MAGFPGSVLHQRRPFISEPKERSEEIPRAKWGVPQTPQFPTNLRLSATRAVGGDGGVKWAAALGETGPALMWNPL